MRQDFEDTRSRKNPRATKISRRATAVALTQKHAREIVILPTDWSKLEETSRPKNNVGTKNCISQPAKSTALFIDGRIRRRTMVNMRLNRGQTIGTPRHYPRIFHIIGDQLTSKTGTSSDEHGEPRRPGLQCSRLSFSFQSLELFLLLHDGHSQLVCSAPCTPTPLAEVQKKNDRKMV